MSVGNEHCCRLPNSEGLVPIVSIDLQDVTSREVVTICSFCRCQKCQLEVVVVCSLNNNIAHTHPFNGPFSGTTRVSRYQNGKPIWILLKQETVSGSGISWAICKSAPRSRQIATPAPHQSVFYRLDAVPAAQPTASKQLYSNNSKNICIVPRNPRILQC